MCAGHRPHPSLRGHLCPCALLYFRAVPIPITAETASHTRDEGLTSGNAASQATGACCPAHHRFDRAGLRSSALVLPHPGQATSNCQAGKRAWGGICQPERGTGWRILLSFGLRGIRRVDPGVRGDFRWLGRLADKSLGVCLESGGQDGSALFADGRGVSVVNVGGGVQAKAAVPVVVVVPGEELLAVGSAS